MIQKVGDSPPPPPNDEGLPKNIADLFNDQKEHLSPREAMYNAKKLPGFKKMLEKQFGPLVTPKMVTRFAESMMQMINESMKQEKEQHEKKEQIIKERYKNG